MYSLSKEQLRKLQPIYQRMVREIGKSNGAIELLQAPWWARFKYYYEFCRHGFIKDQKFVREFGGKTGMKPLEFWNDGRAVETESDVENVLRTIRAKKEKAGVSSEPPKKPDFEAALKQLTKNTPENEKEVESVSMEPSTGQKKSAKQPKRLSSGGSVQKKEIVSLKIEPELWARIKEQAEKEERSASALIRYAVKAYLEDVE